MLNVVKEAAALERLTVGQLRQRHVELFRESTQAGNRVWLIRRILWRLQSLEEGGGLSQRALEQAEELASTSDLRTTAPRQHRLPEAPADRTKKIPYQGSPGSHTPLPGTLLTRQYKGRQIRVRVLTDGFEFEGERYRSLSAVAKRKFFNLDQDGDNA